MKTLLLWPRGNRPTDSLCAVARIPQSVSSIVEIPRGADRPQHAPADCNVPGCGETLAFDKKTGAIAIDTFIRLRFAAGRSGRSSEFKCLQRSDQHRGSCP